MKKIKVLAVWIDLNFLRPVGSKRQSRAAGTRRKFY